MKSNDKPRRTPEETWKAIERGAADDEMDRITALSDAELDAELRAIGFDPEEVREQGADMAARAPAILAEEWKREDELAQSRARLAARRAARPKLDAQGLRDRIALARKDPRLPQPAAVMFRNRKEGEETIEELESMLDELEDLIAESGTKSDP
jgi:hypothetical protein